MVTKEHPMVTKYVQYNYKAISMQKQQAEISLLSGYKTPEAGIIVPPLTWTLRCNFFRRFTSVSLLHGTKASRWE